MYKTSKKLGENRVDIESDRLKSLCAMAAQVPSLECCDLCKSKNLSMHHRNIKDNDYYSVLCGGCGANFKLGQRKKDGALFHREGTTFEIYTPKEQDQSKVPAKEGVATAKKVAEEFNGQEIQF